MNRKSFYVTYFDIYKNGKVVETISFMHKRIYFIFFKFRELFQFGKCTIMITTIENPQIPTMSKVRVVHTINHNDIQKIIDNKTEQDIVLTTKQIHALKIFYARLENTMRKVPKNGLIWRSKLWKDYKQYTRKIWRYEF